MKSLLVLGLLAGSAWAQVETNQVQLLEEREAKAGRFEISLFPAAVQLNGKFTQHVGTFGAVTWHVRERFALQILGGGNWHNVESAFNDELVEKFRVEAQSSASLLWTWGVFGGVEVEPLVAKFTILNGPLVHFGFVLSGGAGAGGTRHQLKPTTDTPPSYGDTAPRFMGTFAAGLRLAVGKHFTVRLEVRDVGYSAKINQVNGCSGADLKELDLRIRAIQRDNKPLSAECRTADFRPQRWADVPLALRLATFQDSTVLHNVGAYLGAGFVF